MLIKGLDNLANKLKYKKTFKRSKTINNFELYQINPIIAQIGLGLENFNMSHIHIRLEQMVFDLNLKLTQNKANPIITCSLM